jgi:hypothetical protein
MTHARRDQLHMHRTKRTRHDHNHNSTMLSPTHKLHSKLALHVPLQPATDPALAKAIPKADRNCGEKANAKQRGSPLVVIHDGPTFANLTHAPQVQQRAVHERDARDNGKCPCSRERERVAKVEQRGGDGANKDGEFEPGEEGALGGELDFGFDAHRDVDA